MSSPDDPIVFLHPPFSLLWFELTISNSLVISILHLATIPRKFVKKKEKAHHPFWETLNLIYSLGGNGNLSWSAWSRLTLLERRASTMEPAGPGCRYTPDMPDTPDSRRVYRQLWW
ncbi:hypothetical protein BO99DRAFT_82960 [Aspergillus violaceofuscus CBS 115571]|uniref:Uncharacterized protein n=1 Tax=Aspergillus violaceofuscus (strain CBS 115571) TaxID=1450538 RepID=A0A2V5HA98_ASPV1|nr:hypothetical protein BO99DRAFT_82960 [Aspergillus violaceofuscus CBS 115571]